MGISFVEGVSLEQGESMAARGSGAVGGSPGKEQVALDTNADAESQASTVNLTPQEHTTERQREKGEDLTKVGETSGASVFAEKSDAEKEGSESIADDNITNPIASGSGEGADSTTDEEESRSLGDVNVDVDTSGIRESMAKQSEMFGKALNALSKQSAKKDASMKENMRRMASMGGGSGKTAGKSKKKKDSGGSINPIWWIVAGIGTIAVAGYVYVNRDK